MKIPSKVIELAMAGDWVHKSPYYRSSDKLVSIVHWPEYLTDMSYFVAKDSNGYLHRVKIAEVILDPLFWQALGKQLGWKYSNEECLHDFVDVWCYHMWKNKAVELYLLLLTNAPQEELEKYWEGLLGNK